MALRHDFGRRLRDRRKQLGKNQADIAYEVGVSTETYGRMERAETGEWLDFIEVLADALETKPIDLFAYTSGKGTKNSEHLRLRTQLKDETAPMSEEDIRALLDQVRTTLKRRSRH